VDSPTPNPDLHNVTVTLTLILTRMMMCGRYMALATNPNADKAAVDK
tara:strand:- start:326 stop:466 length:141 start_codon:yes stop_codon:yes gene_type:complete